MYNGLFSLPPAVQRLDEYLNQMCPANLATYHPAAQKLLEYVSHGCPPNTGQPWSRKTMQAAIDRGPHISVLEPAAIIQLQEEVQGKIKAKQARLIKWDNIKDNPLPELKISPMVPHKSRPYWAILDLSFPVKLSMGMEQQSVKAVTLKMAPQKAIDQIGHSLSRIIQAFATAAPDAKIFMAKWDIKDSFWRLNCRMGEEWNFWYVLPNIDPTAPIKLIVPTSLQMGWVKLPPYFCTASETARDVAAQYAETPMEVKPKGLMHGRRSDSPTCYRARTLDPSTYVANRTYKDRQRRPHPHVGDRTIAGRSDRSDVCQGKDAVDCNGAARCGAMHGRVPEWLWKLVGFEPFL